MARPLRLDLPNCFYHVLNRGVEGRSIFDEDPDYEKFIDLMGLMSDRYAVHIWSYVLMGNHYHMLLRPTESNLSKALQWLGLSYSGYFNRRHRRSGPLFQGRFKSFIVEDGAYLERLICYIHRNPLRAGIVERLPDYAWSSYPCLAYGRRCQPWLHKENLLRYFGGEQKRFRKTVQSYSEQTDSLLEDLKHGILLGGEQMAARLRERLGGEADRDRPQVRKLLRSRSIEEYVREIASAAGLNKDEVEDLRIPIRRRHRPMRDVLIYLVWRNGHHSAVEVGDYFQVTYTALPSARRRGAEFLNKNTKLQTTLKKQHFI